MIYVPYTNVQLLSFPSKLDWPGWSLPPEKTCLQRCDYCYGRKGRYVFKNVKHANLERYKWTQNCLGIKNTRDWIQTMERAIRQYPYFRWHVTGDFYSPEYTEMCYSLFASMDNTKFWINTKSYTDPKILEWLQAIGCLHNVTIRPSSDPGDPPLQVDGLDAGACIDYDYVWQCQGKCDGCTFCWDNRTEPVSYKLK